MGPYIRILVGAVGVLICGAAYVVASDTVDVKECNVTEVGIDAEGCSVGHAVLEGHDKIITECWEGATVGVAQCHFRNEKLYIGNPWDSTGTVVLLGMLSAICVLGAILGGSATADRAVV